MNANIYIGIIELAAALGALIIIHEFGHFIVSRLFKIEVEEFGIGFPPRMLTLFKAAGTKFTLNWIPLGGFVRPKGENDPEVPGGLAAASPWIRLAVLLAGPLSNLLGLFGKEGEEGTSAVLYLSDENGPILNMRDNAGQDWSLP